MNNTATIPEQLELSNGTIGTQGTRDKARRIRSFLEIFQDFFNLPKSAKTIFRQKISARIRPDIEMFTFEIQKLISRM